MPNVAVVRAQRYRFLGIMDGKSSNSHQQKEIDLEKYKLGSFQKSIILKGLLAQKIIFTKEGGLDTLHFERGGVTPPRTLCL